MRTLTGPVYDARHFVKPERGAEIWPDFQGLTSERVVPRTPMPLPRQP
jgi:hypothetical protein